MMNVLSFWESVLKQDAEGLKHFFHQDAVIRWHCTNEQFTVEEYIRANGECPGDLAGEVECIEEMDDEIVTVTHVHPIDHSSSFHVVSFLKMIDGKISTMDEYWADDGPSPQWRQAMKIGIPIRQADTMAYAPVYSTTYTNPKNGERIHLKIRESLEQDLDDIRSLWADGQVMHYVGFPEGLKQTKEQMKSWYDRLIQTKPESNHFSIFADNQYVGESYYRIDREHDNLAALDIKLFPHAHGKGLAVRSLCFAIEQAFKYGADKVYVDPNPENKKALALYERLGFVTKEYPPHLKKVAADYNAVYMEKERPCRL